MIDADAEVRVSRTAPGRGAWVCGPDCVALAVTKRGFDRAWRSKVPTEVLDGIAAVVADAASGAPEADEMRAARATLETMAVRSESTRHERLTTRVKG